MDDSFQDASYNALAAATATNGPSWPNPPWSTELLRGLLENDGFRRDFINNAADHLNATFVSSRLVGIIDEHANRYAPAISTWYARWALTENWNAQVQSFRTFTVNRPSIMRQQYQSFFGLVGTGSVRVDVNDAARDPCA
ncbi:MAG: CotH kinase family protein [bacterium]|nr:CotH kinase family protein [bacterium]